LTAKVPATTRPGIETGLLALLGAVAAAKYLFILFRYDAYGIAKYFLADDAFYYFQVARKIAAGLGSTFDGVHATNGYHPLWMLVSTAAFRIFPGPTAPLVALDVLQVLLLFGSAVALYRALREIDARAAAFTAVLFLASTDTRGILFLGMESTPAFFFTACLLVIALRGEGRAFVPANARAAAVQFALLLGLALSRLEAGLFAFLWLAAAAMRDARQGGRARGRLAFMAAGLAVAAVAYVSVNLRLVGVPFPISGMVKASGHPSVAHLAAIFLRQVQAFAALVGPPKPMPGSAVVRVVLAVVLLAALAGLLNRLRRERPELLLPLVPFLGFGIAFVGVATLVTGGTFPWYFWPALLLGVLATFGLVRAILRFRLAPVLLLLVATLSTATGWVAVARTRTLADWGPMPGVAIDSTVRYLREVVPPGERIAGLSNGMIAYFSGRDQENLDGLVNGVDFLRARRDPRTYGEYLRRNHVRWVLFRTTFTGEREQVLDTFRAGCEIEDMVDLDRFYGLGLKRTSGGLSDPNIWFVRLRD